MPPLASRSFRAAVGLLFLAAAAWPLRAAISAHQIAGSGPDVVVTHWGMWWFSRELTGPAWFGTSTLVNFPAGAVGSVLAPATAALWSVFAAMSDPGFAVTLTGLATLAAWCGCVAWLARLSGVGPGNAAFAGLLALHGRYLVFGLGETSIVGITALPALLAVGALLAWRTNPAPRWLVLLVLAGGGVGLEYPYLVGLAPALALGVWVERRDRGLLAATVAMLVLALVAVEITGRGQITFGSGRMGHTIPLLGLHFPAGEDIVARANLADQLWPRPVRWSTSGASGTLRAGGREYVGLSLVAAALAGAAVRPRRALPFLIVGAGGMMLATGSDWGGFASPFALLNSVAARVVRVLTQPTRFLVLTSAALPVAAAHLLDWLGRRRRWAGVAVGGVLLADMLAFGGLSLELPTSSLPQAPCVAELAGHPRTPVLTLPWDALSDGDAALHSRQWQIVHGQPAAVTGVGSWTFVGDVVSTSLLDNLGVGRAVVGEVSLDREGIRALGFGYVVVDRGIAPWVEEQLRDDLGVPSAECEEAAIWDLGLPIEPDRSALSAHDPPEGWRRRASVRLADRKDASGAPLRAP